MHRNWTTRNRPLLPLPLQEVSQLYDLVAMTPVESFCQPHFADIADEDIWTALSILARNQCVCWLWPCVIAEKAVCCAADSPAGCAAMCP